MKKEEKDSAIKQKTEEMMEKKPVQKKTVIIACILAVVLVLGGIAVACIAGFGSNSGETQPTDPTEPPKVWRNGFIASVEASASYYDAEGTQLGQFLRGTQVQYYVSPEGQIELNVDGVIVYLQEGASVVEDVVNVVPAHTLYVRTAVNLRTIDGKLIAEDKHMPLADKGVAVRITGYDYMLEDGTVHMYQVDLDGETGYIMPWYLVSDAESALANYDDNGQYETHANRSDRYGGGGAANLDYFPREKGEIEGNVMPEECRTLYIASWCVGNIDQYLKAAKGSGINAFVVDIVDGTAVGYASDVMKQYSPSAAKAASNTVEAYQAAIQKIKDAGYYVIGRITTFNDTFFVKDHPECAILDNYGNPFKLHKVYWPTGYDRYAWQYKVDLAVEAVELMGFNEIQFDYVRFPDLTRKYEREGTIDYQNTYGETKAQAIQRFLMYATDILHEKGVYVSADVFGECSNSYVTAYGQYWPAISNVVDAISGMPYPDHYPAEGDWKPWLHPYETLYRFGSSAMKRQSETATPAVVRTWIQAHDAIQPPYNDYGVEELAAQIKGLRDSGCTGGYMTWLGGSSLTKYKKLMPAFTAPAEK